MTIVGEFVRVRSEYSAGHEVPFVVCMFGLTLTSIFKIWGRPHRYWQRGYPRNRLFFLLHALDSQSSIQINGLAVRCLEAGFLCGRAASLEERLFQPFKPFQPFKSFKEEDVGSGEVTAKHALSLVEGNVKSTMKTPDYLAQRRIGRSVYAQPESGALPFSDERFVSLARGWNVGCQSYNACNK